MAVLRTSFDTIKRIKANILELTAWAKHFEYSDLEVLRKNIVDALVFTDKPLEDIKRQIYSKKLILFEINSRSSILIGFDIYLKCLDCFRFCLSSIAMEELDI
jgi:hypothetical protein